MSTRQWTPSERRRCPPSWCFAVPGGSCWLCASATLIVDALLILLGILVLNEKRRYTPIYEDVYLRPTGTGFGNVMLRPLSVELQVYVDCINPNPYELFVLPGGHGKAVVGSQMMEMGTVWVTSAVVPARRRNTDPPSTGTVVMTAKLEADLWTTLSAASLILQGTFTVYFELLVEISVAPEMLGMRVARVGEGVQEFCGLQVQLLPDQVAGDVVCGDSFSSLQVPPLFGEVPATTDAPGSDTEGQGTGDPGGQGASNSDGTDEGFAPPIDEATISEAEEVRDLISGAAMAVCFSLAALLLLFVLSLGLCALRGRKPQAVYGSTAPVETIGRSLEDEAES